MDLKTEDVDDLCTGAAVLGAGGGGDPYIGGLMVKQELAAGRRIEIVDPDTMDEGQLIIPTAMMGAPTVLLEKIPSGEEPIRALRVVEKELGRKADATMPTEVGGINSTIPLFVGAPGHSGCRCLRSGPRLSRTPDGDFCHRRTLGLPLGYCG